MRRWDRRAGVFGKETRHRVFEEDEPVSGKFFKRLLSMGGGTGALIGARHFLTAAHVTLKYNEEDQVLELDDIPIRAGRNGQSHIGETAWIDHLY